MSIKDQVNPAEWKALYNAPVAAATFVASASGGGFEMIKEIVSASKFAKQVAEQATGSAYGAVVDDLLTVMKGMSVEDAKANALKYQSRDPDGIRAEAKQVVADAVAATSAMPGADGFRRWILDMARQVAETKTGGFLGIGAKSVVDEKEQAALAELSTVLGL